MKPSIVFAAALVLGVLAGAAQAHEVKAGDLTISSLAVRATPPGVPNSAGYMTIANAGAKPDKLLSVSCACAARVEAHMSHVMNGQAMMMPAGPVNVPAGGKVAFAPGGLHLMITGLKAPLVDGGMQELTLKFARAGTVKAGFHVRAKIDQTAAEPMPGMRTGH